MGQQLTQRMTNQDVIDMVALGLSDDVIIDKIHAVDATQFDTNIKELRTLKAGRVSDLVIRAMITPHPAATAGNNFTATVNPDVEKGRLPEEVGVYFMRNGRLTELEPEIVGWQTGGVLKHIGTLGIDREHINGKIMKPRSSLQLSSPMEFFIKTQEGTSVTEYQLLRLYEKGNRREFRALTGGVYHASGGAERTAMPFTPEKVSSRIWRIRLNRMERGEYGFLPPGVSASSIAASGKIYAFGVEGEDRIQTAESVVSGVTTEKLVPGQARSTISALGVTAGTRQSGGAVLLEVEHGGMAEWVGLHAGDVINTLDGKPVRTAPELAAELLSRAPGAKIRLGYLMRTSLGSFTKEAHFVIQ
jgi:hypothetical protein